MKNILNILFTVKILFCIVLFLSITVLIMVGIPSFVGMFYPSPFVIVPIIILSVVLGLGFIIFVVSSDILDKIIGV